ncbi:hypothetical protein M3221_18515 [Domibacillus indicus]|uniref:hypothetical protein n=1 Tax=Domibacillus indicus TaxID=1437523 RepID=UPI00203ABD33|nr:hypothetical protein [Domibacillus indicus]MCM3790372.1 hypothetical protein [Domibacillus indicus]
MELNRKNYFSLKKSGASDKNAAERFGVSLSKVQKWKKENLTSKEIRKLQLEKKFVPGCECEEEHCNSSKVHVWYMTEEERLAYIKKHPIRSTSRTKG